MGSLAFASAVLDYLFKTLEKGIKVQVLPSKVYFLFFSFLFSLLAANASSLVLTSEVIILVLFNILND